MSKKLPNNARIAVIIRDDDTSALTPVNYLETVYSEAWKMGFPISLSVVPEICATHNPNIPPSLRGTQKSYPLDVDSKIVGFLQKKIKQNLVEIMLHGYYHTTNNDLRYPAFGELEGYTTDLLQKSSEFYDLEKDEIQKRIKKGKFLLESIFNIPIKSFVAPQEYLTPVVWESLQKVGIIGYSGGIRPQFWRQLPWRNIGKRALIELILATASRKPLWLLGDNVSRLTDIPIIPATCRHYWSTNQSKSDMENSLKKAITIFEEKYKKGNSYFLILTHYWEYFGDWQEYPTHKYQLEGLNKLLEFIYNHEGVWKCTVGEYSEWLRAHN